MKHKFFRNLSAFIFLFILFSNQAFSQTGKIVGKVTDKTTGETLIGLTVGIDGTTKGAATDINGKFQIINLSNGRYNISFRYLGYQTKNVTDVEVTEGQITNLDVIMEQTSAQALQEVVVIATYRQETVGALYAQQKNSAVISDGISSEVIKKSPDRNTGEVLKRVSGTTIQDNKFVIVRGLSDRYNTATLDNGILPSTEPNRKAFSFDIVPSSLVDNIVIRKTASPDISGDFAGGAIQITTKDIPDANFITFGIGTGYNSQSTFKNFKGTEIQFSDYAGFKSSLNLPNNFPSRQSINTGLSQEQANSSINSINRNGNIFINSAMPNQNYQFSIGSLKYLKKTNNKLGSIFALTYRNAQTITPDIERNFYDYRNYSDDIYKFSTSLGALANLGYIYGTSKITLKTIYNKNYDNVYLSRTGFNTGNSNNLRFSAFDLIEKSLFKTTLEGEHQLGKKQSKFKWNLAYSNVANNQPDQFKISYLKGNNVSDIYLANILNAGKENARFYSDLNENIYSTDINLSLPVKFGNKTSSFKTGLSSQYRQRDFNARFIGVVLKTFSQDIQSRPLSTLFSKELVNSSLYKLEEIGNGGDNYYAKSLINAAYAMLDNKFSEKFRLVWGVRAEQYNVQLQTAVSNNREVDQNQIDILPSANLTYSITSKSNLRVSGSRTLARPEFRELAPFAYYDYELLAIQFGNPRLERTHINNGDFRFEYYPAAGQIFSASLFYKNFENAIEPNIYDQNSTPDISYQNAPNASVYGLELEMRKSLNFINENKFFANTSIYTNFSLVKSKVEVVNIDKSISIRPLAGQSPYVINAGIEHTELDNKLSFNILYNKIGRRINRVGGDNFPNVWENPRDLIDFQVGYKTFKKKGEFKLNIGDILNQKSVFYFDYDKNKVYSPNSTSTPTNRVDETVSSYKPGTNISLSFSYTIK